MDWKDVLWQGYIEVDGTRYDVTHLRETTFDIVIPAAPKMPAITTKLNVIYSSHCISEGHPKEGDKHNFSVLGYDKLIVDDAKNERKFSKHRYELSLMLPRIVQALPISDTKTCYFTSDSNYAVVEVIRDAVPVYYHVFFSIRKREKMLIVHIESAYALPEIMPQKKGFSAIRPTILLAKVFRGQKPKR